MRVSLKHLTIEEKKALRNKQERERRLKNPEKFKANKKKWNDKNKDYFKKWAENNKEHKALYNKEWVKNNLEKHKERRNKYENTKRQNNPTYKFICNIRGLINTSFKRGKNYSIKSNKTEEILGCTLEYFIEYITNYNGNKYFIESFGKKGFHIDHIKPISLASTKEEIMALCHYTNLRPLFWIENIQKSNNLI